MSQFENPISRAEEQRLNSFFGEGNEWYDPRFGSSDLLDRIMEDFLGHTDWRLAESKRLGDNNFKIEFEDKVYILEWSSLDCPKRPNDALHEAAIGFILNDDPHFSKTIACGIYDDIPPGEKSYNDSSKVPCVYRLSEYVEGYDLNSFIDNPVNSIGKLKEIFHKIITSYYEVHQKYKFIHGDFHPGNVIITPEGNIVFIDLDHTYIEYDQVSYPTGRGICCKKGQWYKELYDFVDKITRSFDRFEQFIEARDNIRREISHYQFPGITPKQKEKVKKLENRLIDDSFVLNKMPKRNWRFHANLIIIQDIFYYGMTIQEFIISFEKIL